MLVAPAIVNLAAFTGACATMAARDVRGSSPPEHALGDAFRAIRRRISLLSELKEYDA